MPDIQFDDLRQGCDRRNRIEGKAVTGMDFEAERRTLAGSGGDPGKLRLAPDRIALARRLAIGAGMQFDNRRTERMRRLKLAAIRIDEQRNTDTGIAQPRHIRRKMAAQARYVEPALGRHLLAP